MYCHRLQQPAAVNDGSTFATQSVILACSDYTVNNKTEAVFANFKYNVSDQTFVQFGMREQEISAYASNYFFLPLTALVGHDPLTQLMEGRNS